MGSLLAIWLVLLTASLGFTQTIVVSPGGEVDLSGTAVNLSVLIADLPTSPSTGTVKFIHDGATDVDCTAGTGEPGFIHPCVFIPNLGGWIAGSRIGLQSACDTGDCGLYDLPPEDPYQIAPGGLEGIREEILDESGDFVRRCRTGLDEECSPDGFWIPGDRTLPLLTVELDGNEIILEEIENVGATSILHRYLDVWKPLKTIWIPASALEGDETHCVKTTEVTINSGFKTTVQVCADNAAAIMDTPALNMPKSWDCGAVSARLVIADVDSSSQVAGWNFTSQVRNAAAFNSTFGSASTDSTVTMATAHIPYKTTTQTVTANGTCVGDGGDMLVVRATKDAAGSDTDDGDARILGMTIFYTVETRSDE